MQYCINSRVCAAAEQGFGTIMLLRRQIKIRLPKYAGVPKPWEPNRSFCRRTDYGPQESTCQQVIRLLNRWNKVTRKVRLRFEIVSVWHSNFNLDDFQK